MKQQTRVFDRASQEPIHSGFNAASTDQEIMRGIDLSRKVAIVTGGYSGLGLATVRNLSRAGAHVIVPARDVQRATTAVQDIANVEVASMDLMDPVSIDDFAHKFLASDRALHILVNNAAIMAVPLTRDSRGYESHFSTNHLGHFQLTARLWPALRKATNARVVSVSSWGHHRSPVIFEDPNFQRREYERWSGYAQSKTANILFALGLDSIGKEHGLRAFSLHPGSIVSTGLGKHLSKEELIATGTIDETGTPVLDSSRNLKTIAQGVATTLWCATSAQLDGLGGVYCENCDLASVDWQDSKLTLGGSQHLLGVMHYAVDPAAASKLWALSERLTGVTIDN